MSADLYLVRSPLLAWRVIEEETVIISPQERELHILNEVGSAIWRMADGSLTLRQIATQLSETYAVTFEEALADVLAFAQALVDKKLALLSERPTSEEEIEQKGGSEHG